MSPFSTTITLAELIYSELIELVQRTRVSYPAYFDKMRLTENMVDKRKSYTKGDLLVSGRGGLLGAEGPQLPTPNTLMMDRVVKMTETSGSFDKGCVEAGLDIDPGLQFFGYHFIDDPVVPGYLDLDTVWRLVGFCLDWLGNEGKSRTLGVSEMRFTSQVLPTAKEVTYRVRFKRIVDRRLIMGLADGEVLIDGRLIYAVNDLKVGLFQGMSTF